MVIGHQRRVHEIKEVNLLKLNDNEMKLVGKVKSLGVTVDEGLARNDQFKSLTGKPEAPVVLSLRVTYATGTQYGGAYFRLSII